MGDEQRDGPQGEEQQRRAPEGEPGRRGPVDEHIRQLPLDEVDVAAGENPYWAEIPPHPAPSLGCVRRGWCCRSSPGWFAPGEADEAARLLGLEPDEFARRHLVIDGCEVPDHGWVEVFAPVKLDRFGAPALPPLTRVDELYRFLKGPCVFFDGDGCRIYAARPAECRAYVCTNEPEDNLTHETIARWWATGEVPEG